MFGIEVRGAFLHGTLGDCKLPRKRDSLGIDKRSITLNCYHEKNTIYGSPDFQHSQGVWRINPQLYADYGKFVYVVESQSVYKLNPNNTYPVAYREADHKFPFERHFFSLQPDGTKLYSDFESLATSNLDVDHSFTPGSPAVSNDGMTVFYASFGLLKSFDTQTYALKKQLRYNLGGYVGNMKVRADNSIFVTTLLITHAK